MPKATQFMTTYDPGSIVFIDYPYADLGKTKRRPALVVLDSGDADIVVARVTSQAPRTSYDVTVSNWSAAGLVAPSIVRLDKLITIEKSLIIRTLGKLSNTDHQSVGAVIQTLFSGW